MAAERTDAILRRLAKVIVLMWGRRYAPPLWQMAAQLDCSERTVRRYLEALEDAGWRPMPKWRDEVL